jgi:hypothetical protein
LTRRCLIDKSFFERPSIVDCTFPVNNNFGRLLHISSILAHELESIEYDRAGTFFGKKPFIKTPSFKKNLTKNSILIFYIVYSCSFLIKVEEISSLNISSSNPENLKCLSI